MNINLRVFCIRCINCLLVLIAMLSSKNINAQYLINNQSQTAGTAKIKESSNQYVHQAYTVTGPLTVCVGNTTTLHTTLSGGTWHSIDTFVAHIDSITGIVTGIATGTDTISYTTGSGGSDIAIITVNTVPALVAITGVFSVCVSSNITLNDSTSGGTWSISNSNATISGTGVVTGANAGVDTVSYTVVNSCGSTAVPFAITINPLPFAGVISGVSEICVGVSDTFTVSGTGGTWGSITPSKVTVDSLGIATGVSAGLGFIGYSVVNSCSGVTATKIVTIHPLANSGVITGSLNVCEGASITLTDTVSGGVWSVQNGYATDSAGIVRGISAGTDTISYSVTNICNTATTTVTVNVLGLPVVDSILGSSGVCLSSTTTLADSTSGGIWSTVHTHISVSGGVVHGISLGIDTVRYSLTNICGVTTVIKPITVAVTPTSGTITGVDSLCLGTGTVYYDATIGGIWSNAFPSIGFMMDSFIYASSAGTDTIYYTVTNACATSVAKFVAYYLPLPIAGAIISLDSVCLDASILVEASMPGGSWSLSNSVLNFTSGSMVTALNLGTDTVIYTVTTSCGSDYTTKVISVKALPDAGVITGNDSVCIYGSLTLSDSVSFGEWSCSNANASVIGGVVTGLIPGEDTIVYTYTNSCGTATTQKTITINPLLDPGIISGYDSLCVGGHSTITESVSGGIWSSNNGSISTVSSGILTGIGVGSDTIVYTVSNSCGASSAQFIVHVITTLSPAVSGRTYVCIGSLDTLYGSPSGGIWNVSNSNASVTNTFFGGLISGNAEGNDTVSYTTSNLCGATSIDVPILVSKIAHPFVSGISYVCIGKTDTLHVTPDGGSWSFYNSQAWVLSIPGAGVAAGNYPGRDTLIYSVTNVCGTGSYYFSLDIYTQSQCDSMNGVTAIQQNDFDFTIYPNPNSGSFFVDLNQNKAGYITIMDLSGRLIYRKEFTDASNQLQMELSNLTDGVYVITLEIEHHTYWKRLVVMPK